MKNLKWTRLQNRLVLQNLTLTQKVKILNQLNQIYQFQYAEESNHELVFTDLSKEMEEELKEIITLISP